ncbi:MAG: acyltransferase family protein, partial [Candidatus Microbacterium stercoravium]
MTATPVRTRRDARAATRGFRPDIQALRALAVMSVMLYHLWPNRLTGGFVGVDVFFVISGYLITSHLIRERAKTGRIALGRFWARRAARLLPASLLVLVLVGLATLAFVPNALWPQFFGDVTASALYVQNWHLLFDSVDYLAADNLASPVQHFWTLSAEEQFYVLLPLLMVLSMWVFRKLPWRMVMLVAIAAATVASFVFSIVQVELAPSAAYFSTFTRAWEFGAGALLAFVPAVTRA